MGNGNNATVNNIKLVIEKLNNLNVDIKEKFAAAARREWNNLHVLYEPAKDDYDPDNVWMYVYKTENQKDENGLILAHSHDFETMRKAVDVVKPLLNLKKQKVVWVREELETVMHLFDPKDPDGYIK